MNWGRSGKRSGFPQIDLNLPDLATSPVTAVDRVVYVDADDNGSKKTAVPDLAAAMGVINTIIVNGG